MKVLLYTDVHWCATASIVRGRGKRFSKRLENLIESLNWAEELSAKEACDAVICLGDFFDKPTCTAEELTALATVKWNRSLPHYVLVGNHDAVTNDLSLASTYALDTDLFRVIDKPTRLPDLNIANAAEVILLPYILEEDRKPLEEYYKELKVDNSLVTKKIVLSHNDLAGIKIMGFTTVAGFQITDILNNSDLFINGHLHNSGFVDEKEKILNLGNLSGTNFSEDATIYAHYACVLDTASAALRFYENPFAFNFYKFEVNKESDIGALAGVKSNAVVSVKCKEEFVPEVKKCLESNSHVSDCRVTTVYDFGVAPDSTANIEDLTFIDYIKQFKDYVLENIGSSDIIKEELSNIVNR